MAERCLGGEFAERMLVMLDAAISSGPTRCHAANCQTPSKLPTTSTTSLTESNSDWVWICGREGCDGLEENQGSSQKFETN